ncbi:acyltransferase [Loktanella sp. SALINAS62]|nr:acyltransferase [Loktanella sp. SALINAS62]
MIRAMENAGGRLGLLRRARGYDGGLSADANFWTDMTDRYGLGIEFIGGSLADLPATGPLVVVANHPYGILDGLILGRILSDARQGEFRILANKVFHRAADLERVILPISFDGTKDATVQNMQTRSAALAYLRSGGCVGIFPGGTVSTARTPLGAPLDPVWRSFAAKMIAKSGATVVPIFFDGANSRLFQIASHLNYNLRMGLLIPEFVRKLDSPVRLVVGKPIPPSALHAHRHDANACMDFLRKATYDLSPRPIDPVALGFEFEARYKGHSNGGGNFRQRFGRADRS